MMKMDLSAYFIGPKAENGGEFKALLNQLIDEHLGWRENYFPEDSDTITECEKRTPEFEEAVLNMRNVLNELSIRMRESSIPWHSERYWAQMNSETLMPAILAYNFAMLWNGNNVAWEGAPAGTLLEHEVGQQLSKLMGFEDNGWGHITTDGTIANMEGLWYARNIKSIPLAVKEVCPELVEGKSEWQLLNVSVSETLDLLEKSGNKQDLIKAKSAKSGKNIQKLGKWLVPSTMHYSWPKGIDVLGIGEDNLVDVPVDSHFRMKIDELENIIRKFAAEQIPTLGVVAVVGSTEEGAVDKVDEIIALREKLRKEGIDFYVHVDAAYGGYGRAVYIDENYNWIPYEKMEEYLEKYNIDATKHPMLKENVYKAYEAIKCADSVTVDPHKMGYVPYSAGGIAISNEKMKNILAYDAPYVFEKGFKIPASIGVYILEGSKSTASAAAIWAAHKTIPLNISGYGKLVAHTASLAQRMKDYLDGMTFNIKGHEIVINAIVDPDFNMINWTYKEKGNNSLADMNDLTQKVFDFTSPEKCKNIYFLDLITSHTIFNYDVYGNSPEEFIEKLGMPQTDWEKEHRLVVLRASCMSPYMNSVQRFNEWAEKIKIAMEEKLNLIF